jgi:hypothetical protein
MASETDNLYTLWREKLENLTGMERMFAQRWLDLGYAEKGSEIDFIARSKSNSTDKLIFRRIADYYDNNEETIDPDELDVSRFQITYDFPSRARDNVFYNGLLHGVYGEANFSFRLLYEFLCKTFNDGEYFIDRYLRVEFKQTGVYERFLGYKKNMLRRMAEELKAEKKRLRGGGAFKDVRGRFKRTSEATMRDIRQEFSRVVNDNLDNRLFSSTEDAAKAVRDLVTEYGLVPDRIDKSAKSDSVYLYINNIFKNELHPRSKRGAPAKIRFTSDGHDNNQIPSDAEVVINTGKMLDDMIPIIVRELPRGQKEIHPSGAYDTLQGSVIGGWRDFSLWRDEQYRRELVDIGDEIKEDIINGMSTGRVHLNKTHLAESTIDRRTKLGLNPNRVFFASEQLIRSMSIYIALDKEAA